MKLFNAKCPNCGASVEVTEGQKKCTCSHCNGSFLVDDAENKKPASNSYNIGHATIINQTKNEAFEEVDRYIALYNLNEFGKINECVETLKNKYPQKGISRIVVLNFQLTKTISQLGGYGVFKKEFEEIEERYNNYMPKSYKDTPKLSSFYSHLGKIETKYAEDIDEVLTDEEKSKYGDLINQTKRYFAEYQHVCSFNDKMNEKFAPYIDKYNEKARKNANKRKNASKKFTFVSFFLICVAILLVAASVANNYLFYKKTYIEYGHESYNTNNLESPDFYPELDEKEEVVKIGGVSVTMHYLGTYTIYGRVCGRKNTFGFSTTDRIFTTKVFLSWGDLSKTENSYSITWKYDSFGSYHYNWTLNADEAYMAERTSMNELIASTKDIKKGLRNIKNNEIVKIEGYLVDITVNKTSEQFNSEIDYTENGTQIIYVTNISWISG